MGQREVKRYEDPVGEAPWAMQFVVRVERVDPPTVSDVCVATAVAAVTLLDEAEVEGWQAEVDRWLDGRIRKIVRRARGAAWTRVVALPGVTVRRGTAEVRAFVPGPTDAVPPELSKLQVEGLVLEPRDGADPAPPVPPVPPVPPHAVVVSMNPRWDLDAHPGKAAAQAAHAVQLAASEMDESRYESWRSRGFPVRVDWPDAKAWPDLERSAPVVVTDAGYTVVDPGARTCVAHWA